MLVRSISSEYLGSYGYRFPGRRFYIRENKGDFLLLDAVILLRRSFDRKPENRRPVWVGDLNVTRKTDELCALQRTIGKRLYGFREYDTLPIAKHPPCARRYYAFYVSSTGVHRGEYDGDCGR